jgi:hypothetical protein
MPPNALVELRVLVAVATLEDDDVERLVRRYAQWVFLAGLAIAGGLGVSAATAAHGATGEQAAHRRGEQAGDRGGAQQVTTGRCGRRVRGGS